MVFKESFIPAQMLYRWVLFPWQKIVYQVVWQFCRISHANLSAPKPNPPFSNFDANVVSSRSLSRNMPLDELISSGKQRLSLAPCPP